MSLRTKFFQFLMLWPLFGWFSGSSLTAYASGITLYTPYTKIEVTPGESIDYSIDIINKGGGVRNVELAVTGLAKDWSYDLKSGGWKVDQIAVLPGEKKTLSLKVEVPLKIDKGTYRFQVVAKGAGVLPLAVVVSEQGTLTTELTSRQPNMQGNSGATFSFNAVLNNRTGDSQVYSLRSEEPRGWNVAFKVNGKQVSSVQAEANAKTDIMVEVDPSDEAAAGMYKIPIVAGTSQTSAGLELEVEITGSYKMELSTPTGLLSTEVTAGDDRKVELVVRNTGSVPMGPVELSAAAPANWEVTFEPKKVDRLEPGKNAAVTAAIKADKKALAGDYVVNIEAKTPETSSRASFRVAVATSIFSGWIGIMIMLIALGNVYYLFRKYGRR